MRELREGLTLADRYTLAGRLGAGGMSETWRASDARAGSDIALKFLDANRAANAAARELFHSEWRSASRLMHAHIVRVFEYYDEEQPFYALQYLDGPGIAELCGQPLASFLPAFGSVADALRYAHGKNVVHGDVTSGNLLLDGRGSPYLIDFGLAAAGDGGTPAALSPERQKGEPPSPADDVYALGVLLHEMVAGSPPDAGNVSLPGTRLDGEAVPASIASLIDAMLAEDPSARPTAEQVADRLDAAGHRRGAAQLPAALRRVGGHVPDAEIAVRPRAGKLSAAAPAAAAPAKGEGISARLVYAGLAALLVVLVGVAFLLPDAVREDDASPAVEPATTSAVDEPGAGDAPAATPEDGDETAAVAPDATPRPGIDGGTAGFSENVGTSGGLTPRQAADEALGNLLSIHERLKYRGIERWGGQPYLDALDVYAEGDEAYINNSYETATDRYTRTAEMLDPFFDRIDDEFRRALAGAREAFERRDPVEAIRLYDLAVAITPGHPGATTGLARARSLGDVLELMQQGRQFLAEDALEAARIAFENALDLDPEWQPAEEELAAVQGRLTQRSFEARMSEGFNALSANDFATARVAFEAAGKIYPGSPEPADGLQQVDQELRLYRIRTMEDEAAAQEDAERWETAVSTYEALLEVDGDLAFAKEGLARARQRAGLHRQLQNYVDDPDSLSDPVNLQKATELMLGISRMENVGPRLTDHKDTLARLLKRAATPLTVELVSDNATEVSLYRVGRLGTFGRREVELRPGSYVAVGVRPGFRDVRREFRVAPEIDMQPIVVQCEEPI